MSIVLAWIALAATRPAFAAPGTAPRPLPLLSEAQIGTALVRGQVALDATVRDAVDGAGIVGVEGAWPDRAALRATVAAGLEGAAPRLGLEARVAVLNQDRAWMDGALGLRYKQVGFRGEEGEVEGFFAAGKDLDRSRLNLNAAFGVGLREPEWDGELGAAWRWRASERLDAGLMGQGRLGGGEGEEEREEEREREERRWDLTAGPFLSLGGPGWALTGLVGLAAAEAGVGGRGLLALQLAW